MSVLRAERGRRIGLSPWARAALDPDELDRLEARCADLDVVVSTVKRGDNGWMVRVAGRYRTSLVGYGPVSAVIAGALADHEEAAA